MSWSLLWGRPSACGGLPGRHAAELPHQSNLWILVKASVLVLLLPNLFLAQMGSPGGGETQAIALHPTEPHIIYVGAAKGLCKTTKAGKDNWPSSGLETYSPRVIVINPTNPDKVYAGTYEMGIYRTSDAAQTWKAVNSGLSDPHIRALVIDPATPETLYAGADGGGVFKTTNGAATWEEANHGLIDKTIRALLIHPGNPQILYAATWHGVYKTTNGAGSWTANPSGLYDVDVAALAFDPSNPEILYAGTNPRGVWRTSDGGATWVPGDKPLTEYIQSIAVDPSNATHVYAGTRAGVWRSTNSGRTFQRAGLAWSNSAWTLVFDPRTAPATLYYGGVGGVLKTTTGGRWWDITGPRRK